MAFASTRSGLSGLLPTAIVAVRPIADGNTIASRQRPPMRQSPADLLAARRRGATGDMVVDRSCAAMGLRPCDDPMPSPRAAFQARGSFSGTRLDPQGNL